MGAVSSSRRKDEACIRLAALASLHPATDARRRGAVPAAGALAAFAPPLPEAASAAATTEKAQAAIMQAHAACGAVEVLLWCTSKVVTAAPDALAPDVLFRLAACANFALGPGLTAAALAHQLAAGQPRGAARVEAAPEVGTLCSILLSCVGWLGMAITALGTAKPAAALHATVGWPERLAAVCGGCTPILSWCIEVLGE